MKTPYIVFLLLGILLLPQSVKAQIQMAPPTIELLKSLDKFVENKQNYRQAREKTLSLEKRKAEKLEGVEKQLALYSIFKNYARFQTDSAMIYLNKMAHTPPHNEDLSNRLRIAQAEIYAVTGNYSEAEALFQTVNTDILNNEMRLEYFHLNRTLYGWMAEFAVETETRQKMLDLTRQYRDSILRYQPKGINYNIVRADSANVSHLPDLALEISVRDTATAQGNEITFIHYNMSVAYGLKGDKNNQMYYLALTAISDIKNGTTEYEALPRLALLCYEANDLDRAYRYLVCSMEDANFCKARLRTIEVSKIFPIIDRAYKEQESERSKMSHALIYGLCALAFLLVIVVFYLRRQMRRLSATRKELALANEKLKGSNENLKATDRVKEEYIARYLDRCRSYIDTLENFRRGLLKRFKAHQMEELYKELKSEETVHNEQERFLEEFDNTFLNLYPNFVQDFNALLQPDAHIYPKGGELLTTELRIFALIRLGVTDSQRIAHFLNYSVATIYSYRSKVRNKARCDKTIFEEEVRKLS